MKFLSANPCPFFTALAIICLTACSSNENSNTPYAQSLASDVEFLIPPSAVEASKSNVLTHGGKDSLLVIGESYENQFEYHITEKPAEINLYNRLICLVQQGDEFDPLEDANPSEFNTINLGYILSNDASVKVYKDVWAKSQAVISIELSKNIDAADWLASNIQPIESIFNQCIHKLELTGIEGFDPPKANKYCDSIQRIIYNSFAINVPVPRNFRVMQSDSNYLIMGNAHEKDGFEMLIFEFIPESKSIAFSNLPELIKDHDLFTKRIFPIGEHENVTVSYSGAYRAKFIQPLLPNCKSAIKGWLTQMGTFRRGPFERYYIHDAKNHRYIAIDWFAGGKNKYNQTSLKMRLIIQKILTSIS